MATPPAELDWDELRFFLRAVQAGTLAGAARVMGVEHSTVGRRLSALERMLGAPLVLRGPEGLSLTPLGAEVLPLAEEIERQVNAVRERATSRSLRVRLAMPSAFPRLFTAGLARLKEQHPELSLEILSGSRRVDLARGEADLAIRTGPITDPELVVRKLGESGWVLYASQGYLSRHPAPADPENLAGHDVVAFDPSLGASPMAQWIETRAARGTIVLRCREVTDMLTAALGGAGVVLLPCLFGDAERTLTRLTPRPVVSHRVCLVHRPESRHSHPIRAVIRFVVEVMKEHADEIAGAPRGD